MFTTINYVNEQKFVFFLGQGKRMTEQQYIIGVVLDLGSVTFSTFEFQTDSLDLF